jgi:sugar/nucleoside kinase (ribokinase family)
VVGDVNTDVVVVLAGDPAPGSDRAATITSRGGGAGANVAVHLAGQGVDVVLAGAVGDDAAGTGLAAELRAAGVRTALRCVPGAATGTVVSLVEPDGQRSMLTDRGANLELRPGDLPPPAAGGHVHLSGYALLDERSRPAGLAALAAARAAGATVSVDPASTGPLAATGVDRWLTDTEGAELLLPNRDEALLLADCSDPAAAARALAGRYGAVAVSLGAEGALWAAGAAVLHRPAVPTAVVDTTGAGDAFTAGVLAGWLAAPDADPTVVLDTGLTLAARVVRRPGAR